MGVGAKKGKSRVGTGSGSTLFLLLCLLSPSLRLLCFFHPWPVNIVSSAWKTPSAPIG